MLWSPRDLHEPEDTTSGRRDAVVFPSISRRRAVGTQTALCRRVVPRRLPSSLAIIGDGWTREELREGHSDLKECRAKSCMLHQLSSSRPTCRPPTANGDIWPPSRRRDIGDSVRAIARCWWASHGCAARPRVASAERIVAAHDARAVQGRAAHEPFFGVAGRAHSLVMMGQDACSHRHTPAQTQSALIRGCPTPRLPSGSIRPMQAPSWRDPATQYFQIGAFLYGGNVVCGGMCLTTHGWGGSRRPAPWSAAPGHCSTTSMARRSTRPRRYSASTQHPPEGSMCSWVRERAFAFGVRAAGPRS